MSITLFLPSGTNSEEFASVRPATFLAYSTTAICIPRQIPNSGTLFSRAYLIASIIPSIPLSPNPPGTMIPSHLQRIFSAVSLVISSELIHSMFTLASFTMPPCLRASATDRYASGRATYFPTRPIVTSFFAAFWRFIISVHSVRSGVLFSSFRCSHTQSARPSFSSITGTSYSEGAVRFWITSFLRTLQNIPIFSSISSGISHSLLQTSIFGWIPSESISFTECCVGFDFSSFDPAINGISVTWIDIAFSRPTSVITCLIDSRNGVLSISPTVPPISVITTSVSLSFPTL